MNLWKLIYPIGSRELVAVVAALTPNDARGMLAKSPSFSQVTGTGSCKQLGTAATDIRAPEIIVITVT